MPAASLVCQWFHCWSDHRPDVVLKDLCSGLHLESAQQSYQQAPICARLAEHGFFDRDYFLTYAMQVIDFRSSSV